MYNKNSGGDFSPSLGCINKKTVNRHTPQNESSKISIKSNACLLTVTSFIIQLNQAPIEAWKYSISHF